MSDQLYIAYFKEKEDIGNCKAKAIYNLRMHQSKNLIKLVTKDQNRHGQELVTLDVFVCFFLLFKVMFETISNICRRRAASFGQFA